LGEAERFLVPQEQGYFASLRRSPKQVMPFETMKQHRRAERLIGSLRGLPDSFDVV
jgi:hypothetical protein